MSTKQVNITRTITRNYGAITSTWTIQMNEQVSTRADVLRLCASADETIHAAMLDYEANSLKQIQPAPKKTIADDQKGETGEGEFKWVKAVGIVKVHEKGKVFYKARTSDKQFVKFGLPVYFDNFKGMSELEFSKRADEDGELVFDEGMMFLAVKEKNGWRARRLAHKDMIEA